MSTSEIDDEVVGGAEVPRGDNYGRIENGERRILYWMLGVTAAVLIAIAGAAATAMWGMSDRLSDVARAETDTNAQVSRLQDEFDRYIIPDYQRR